MEEQSSVEKITSKILEDAQNRSQEIVGEAKDRAREKTEASRRKGEAVKKELLDEAGRLAEQAKRKMVSEGKIKARTTLLEAKEKMISRAFELAEKELAELPKDKAYPGVLLNLARDSCIEIGGGDLKLLVRKDDEKILSREVKKLEDAVKKATGKTTKLSIVSADIGPGVIVKRGDGAVEIDSTFKNRLDLLRSELRLKVAEALFK